MAAAAAIAYALIILGIAPEVILTILSFACILVFAYVLRRWSKEEPQDDR